MLHRRMIEGVGQQIWIHLFSESIFNVLKKESATPTSQYMLVRYTCIYGI